MDLFNFGKYKDRKVSDIIQEDPSYVEWAQRNVSWFHLDESQQQNLDSILKNNSSHTRTSKSFTYPDMRCFPDDGEYDPESMFGSYRLENETFGPYYYADW